MALAALLAAAAPAPRLLVGEFGGRQARLVAGPDSSELTLGCSSATVRGPIRLDRSGIFSVAARMETYAGGPQRVDEDDKSAPLTRFDGELSGSTLTLTITRASGPPIILHLERGMARKVIACL